MESVEAHLKGRFEKYPWIKLKRVKELFYKGKPSILLRYSSLIQICRLDLGLIRLLQPRHLLTKGHLWARL